MKSIQDILPFVEMPSQYLGTEINSVHKNLADIKLRIVLAFPDKYEIGTSHFGIQILYHILNRHPEIAAERVFAPGNDMAEYLTSSQVPLMSLESKTSLRDFDILGFSLLYELNYTNILFMLDLAGIPFYSRHRNDTFPLVIAGGPCTCNPEPVADFFDAMVIGDGEEVIMQMANAWLEWKDNGNHKREDLLKTWSNISGVYIPTSPPPFGGRGESSDHCSLTTDHLYTDHFQRAILSDLDPALFPDSPIVPFGKPVHDRLRLEISRGCTRGCRFCQAGMIYRPVRERNPETILSLADKSIRSTGYEDLSLLSLSTGDYTHINELMTLMMERCLPEHIALSLPSIRAGTLTPEMMEIIKKVRKTGFTIAPEAGSSRLRKVINKNIYEEDIIKTVSDAFTLGWQVIKLYFMIGLPTETDADIIEIIRLVKELGQVKGHNGRKGKIMVSVGTFIPKPHTPFQWAAQISLEEAKHKLDLLKDSLMSKRHNMRRINSLQLKWQKPELSMLEGLWARGDRNLSRLLVSAYQKGCRFDGWSEQFRYDLWQSALSEQGIDIDFYTTRQRSLSEPLPWDHVVSRISKDFLKSEYEKALREENTSDCRNGQCQNCGVCDFDKILPKKAMMKEKMHPSPQKGGIGMMKEKEFHHSSFIIHHSFSKTDSARFFGHLELINIFTRAIRRAKIPIKYSEGFHPMPKISFDDPLPVGMESLNERFCLTLYADLPPEQIAKELNAQLPKGLAVQPYNQSLSIPSNTVKYHIYLKGSGIFDKEKLNDFFQRTEFILTRTNQKGKTRQIDLKEAIVDITISSIHMIELLLKKEQGKTIRPAEVMRHIFELPEEVIKNARIIKEPLI